MRGFFCPEIHAVPYALPTSADVAHACACAEILRPLVTEARLAKLDHVAAHRSRHLSVVLENVYQSRNASAVMRRSEEVSIVGPEPVRKRTSVPIPKERKDDVSFIRLLPRVPSVLLGRSA